MNRVRSLVLDDDLLDRPAVEPAARCRPRRCTSTTRRRRGSPPASCGMRRGLLHDQPVGGQDDRVDDVRDLDQIVQHPGQIVLRCRVGHAFLPWSSLAVWVPVARRPTSGPGPAGTGRTGRGPPPVTGRSRPSRRRPGRQAVLAQLGREVLLRPPVRQRRAGDGGRGPGGPPPIAPRCAGISVMVPPMRSGRPPAAVRGSAGAGTAPLGAVVRAPPSRVPLSGRDSTRPAPTASASTTRHVAQRRPARSRRRP